MQRQNYSRPTQTREIHESDYGSAGENTHPWKKYQGDGNAITKSQTAPVASGVSSFTRKKVQKEMLDWGIFHFYFSSVFSSVSWG